MRPPFLPVPVPVRPALLPALPNTCPAALSPFPGCSLPIAACTACELPLLRLSWFAPSFLRLLRFLCLLRLSRLLRILYHTNKKKERKKQAPQGFAACSPVKRKARCRPSGSRPVLPWFTGASCAGCRCLVPDRLQLPGYQLPPVNASAAAPVRLCAACSCAPGISAPAPVKPLQRPFCLSAGAWFRVPAAAASRIAAGSPGISCAPAAASVPPAAVFPGISAGKEGKPLFALFLSRCRCLVHLVSAAAGAGSGSPAAAPGTSCAPAAASVPPAAAFPGISAPAPVKPLQAAFLPRCGCARYQLRPVRIAPGAGAWFRIAAGCRLSWFTWYQLQQEKHEQ